MHWRSAEDRCHDCAEVHTRRGLQGGCGEEEVSDCPLESLDARAIRRIEAGAPSTAFGCLLSVLHALGDLRTLGNSINADQDQVGLVLDQYREAQRIRGCPSQIHHGQLVLTVGTSQQALGTLEYFQAEEVSLSRFTYAGCRLQLPTAISHIAEFPLLPQAHNQLTNSRDT